MAITLEQMLNLIWGGDTVSIQDGKGDVRFYGMVTDFWKLPESESKDVLLKTEVSRIRSYNYCTVILLK